MTQFCGLSFPNSCLTASTDCSAPEISSRSCLSRFSGQGPITPLLLATRSRVAPFENVHHHCCFLSWFSEQNQSRARMVCRHSRSDCVSYICASQAAGGSARSSYYLRAPIEFSSMVLCKSRRHLGGSIAVSRQKMKHQDMYVHPRSYLTDPLLLSSC